MVARPQIVVSDVARSPRRMRRPTHPFQVQAPPYAICPFLLAPVLPGETLKNLMFQSRAVSDPVKSPLIGWWLEHYVFYVKHRDLAERDQLVQMMVDAAWLADPVEDLVANTRYYHKGEDKSINWMKLCMRRVVEEYFRNDGEAWDGFLVDGGYPAAQINGNSFLDSATIDSAYISDDFTVDLNADTVIKASEVEKALRMWETLRMQGLTAQSYEEYLMSHGVSMPQTELHRPELIRYSRAWQYPSNTVEPTTGVPSSALSWSISERADKDRYFKEPGFIFGVTVGRPKVYMSNIRGSMAHYMNDAYSWLPVSLRSNYEHALKKFANTSGPLNAQTNPYWIDVRDLLIHGEQFINFGFTATDRGLVALPTAALGKRYVDDTSLKALFVDNVNKYFVKQDGVVDLAIMSSVQDVNPSINV